MSHTQNAHRRRVSTSLSSIMANVYDLGTNDPHSLYVCLRTQAPEVAAHAFLALQRTEKYDVILRVLIDFIAQYCIGASANLAQYVLDVCDVHGNSAIYILFHIATNTALSYTYTYYKNAVALNALCNNGYVMCNEFSVDEKYRSDVDTVCARIRGGEKYIPHVRHFAYTLMCRNIDTPHNRTPAILSAMHIAVNASNLRPVIWDILDTAKRHTPGDVVVDAGIRALDMLCPSEMLFVHSVLDFIGLSNPTPHTLVPVGSINPAAYVLPSARMPDAADVPQLLMFTMPRGVDTITHIQMESLYALQRTAVQRCTESPAATTSVVHIMRHIGGKINVSANQRQQTHITYIDSPQHTSGFRSVSTVALQYELGRVLPHDDGGERWFVTLQCEPEYARWVEWADPHTRNVCVGSLFVMRRVDDAHAHIDAQNVARRLGLPAWLSIAKDDVVLDMLAIATPDPSVIGRTMLMRALFGWRGVDTHAIFGPGSLPLVKDLPQPTQTNDAVEKTLLFLARAIQEVNLDTWKQAIQTYCATQSPAPAFRERCDGALAILDAMAHVNDGEKVYILFKRLL